MKKFFTVLLCLVAPLCAIAQAPTADKCEVFRPKALGETILKESSVNTIGPNNRWGQNITPPSKTYWEAYSDREGNIVYKEPSLSAQQLCKLAWNEVLRIAKIQNDFALVYKEPVKNIAYPNISGNAVFYGWVPMKNLLLWSGCLSDDNGIFYKALLCSNFDEVSKKQGGALAHETGYLVPDKNGQQYKLASGGSQFFYVMKRENGMTLLAQQSTLEGSLSRQMLTAWVESHNFVPWNQRTCLEPNWNQEDVEYFLSRRMKVHQIYGKPELTDYLASVKVPVRDSLPQNAQDIDPEVWDNLFRWPGDRLRLPILGSHSNAWNVSTFVTPGSNTIDPDPKQYQQDSLKKATLEAKLRFNIVFVVDGTNSMKPYFAGVRDAIKESLDFFEKGQKVKVGVVVYRNKADGEKVTAVCPLTASENIARVIGFLDKVEAASVGLTEEEALYTGLNAALDGKKIRFGKGESNMIMVVGDCGEKIEGSDTQRAEIVKKLVEKDIHLMAFQVKNINRAAYTLFTSQMNYLIRNTMLQNNRKYISSPEAAAKINVTYVPLTENGAKGNKFYAKNTNINDLYIGSNCVSDPSVNNGIMPVNVLTKLITGGVADVAAAIQKQLDLLVSPQNALVKPGDGEINLGEAFVKKMLGAGIGQGAVVNFSGYTRKTHSSGRDYFKPVLFIEEKELQELLRMLEPVKKAADESNAEYRKPYIDALRALVAGLTGSLSDATLSRMTQQDIMNMIGGLNAANKAAQGPTLDELNDPRIVPNNDYLAIINDFVKKIEELRYIANSEDYRKRYAKEFNGECFYWIPVEKLP